VLDLPLGEAEVLGEDVWQAYLSQICALPRSDARDVRVAYTPMHGVGLETLLAAFDRAGFAPPAVVAEQAEPDPDFPTVAFPNPEEPGALDLLLRCPPTRTSPSPPTRTPTGSPSPWATAAARRPRPACCSADHLLSSGVRGRVATTVVSSQCSPGGGGVRRAVQRDAHRLQAPAPGRRRPRLRLRGGARRRRRAGTRARQGRHVAALLVAELAALEKARGRTLLDRLADLEARHGRHETRQLSYRVRDVSLIRDTVSGLRDAPPQAYGVFEVIAVEQPADDVLVHRLVGGRVVVRPSGTEPKLKAYLELVDPPPGAMDALAAAIEERLGLGERPVAVDAAADR
jgi:phosphomannomutase